MNYTEQRIEKIYELEHNEKLEVGEILRKLYVDEEKSERQIAVELIVSLTTVHKLLKQYNITTRKAKFI